jgi:hypothetical protein
LACPSSDWNRPFANQWLKSSSFCIKSKLTLPKDNKKFAAIPEPNFNGNNYGNSSRRFRIGHRIRIDVILRKGWNGQFGISTPNGVGQLSLGSSCQRDPKGKTYRGQLLFIH